MKVWFVMSIAFLGVWCVETRTFRVAWLAPTTMIYDFSGPSSSGALALGLNDAFNHSTLLTGHDVTVIYKKSECNTKDSLESLLSILVWKPDVIIGPPCSAAMRPIGQVASIKNIPVFGWVSSDDDLANKETYSTMIRLLGPLNGFGFAMIKLMNMFGWNHVTMIESDGGEYTAVAVAVRNALDNANFTIAGNIYVKQSDDTTTITRVLTSAKNTARIILMVLPWKLMRSYMVAAYDLGMTGGDYAFLNIEDTVWYGEEQETFVFSSNVWQKNDSNDDKARTAFECVLHIVMEVLDRSQQEAFNSKALAEAAKDPWRMILPKATQQDRYSPYLYDSVITWAHLTNATLAEGGNISDGKAMHLKSLNYSAAGLTGSIEFDDGGDRIPNFWVLDLASNGRFEKALWLNIRKTVENAEIRWADGKVGEEFIPNDDPACGFDGRLCLEPPWKPDPIALGIGSVGAFLVLTAAILAAIFTVRKMTLDKLKKSTVWKIDFDQLDFTMGAAKSKVQSFLRASFRSHVTVDSSGTAKEEKQIFTNVASYRGNMVAVKQVQKDAVDLDNNQFLELNSMSEMKHGNICSFIGACVEIKHICVCWEYCSKGSLQDIIWNDNIQLDNMFKFSVATDIAKGLDYIHHSRIGFHGNLKSSNCVIDNRWSCKLTDFGLQLFRKGEQSEDSGVYAQYSRLQWTAPEILRGCKSQHGTMQGDIYSLAVVLKEIICRDGPYSTNEDSDPESIIHRLIKPNGVIFFRPHIPDDVINEFPGLFDLIKTCWSESPDSRPLTGQVVKIINKNNPYRNVNVIDHMVSMLEKYANNLEEIVAERTTQLEEEKEKSEDLLYRMLPRSVAEDLKRGLSIEAESFKDVTIYFSDIVGFTKLSASSTPMQIVNMLNHLYTLFDDILTRHDVYKVETIGDAYMIVSGLPKRNGTRHIAEIASCALAILSAVLDFKIYHKPHQKLQIRIGIHCGSVVSGVVGLTMPRYCLFGDTVNTASRMESTGEPYRIHMSDTAHAALSQFSGFITHPRGNIPIKGKGNMSTFFLVGKHGFQGKLPAFDMLEDPAALPPNLSGEPETLTNVVIHDRTTGTTNRAILEEWI